MIKPGELIFFISPDDKGYIRVFDPKDELHTHHGKIPLSFVEQKEYGDEIETHLGHKYLILKPTLYDILKNIKRKTQIIYPKDIGYILLKLGIKTGTRVVEAGSGSGSLTVALAWYVGEEGKVFTYERREEFFSLCKENLDRVGLTHRVIQLQRDIADGFERHDADCAFIDVKTPWEYLDQLIETVKSGSPVGFLLPTTNQVSTLLSHMEKKGFLAIEVLEILIRKYKPVPERLRPQDRMVAHTGYLVFSRIKK